MNQWKHHEILVPIPTEHNHQTPSRAHPAPAPVPVPRTQPEKKDIVSIGGRKIIHNIDTAKLLNVKLKATIPQEWRQPKEEDTDVNHNAVSPTGVAAMAAMFNKQKTVPVPMATPMS